MTKVRTEDDNDTVLRDGQTLRVSVFMMDSLQKAVAEKTVVTDTARHKPGSLALTDADKQKRETLYRDYETSLNSRWKNPPPTPNNHRNPVNQLNAEIGVVGMNAPGDPNAAARIAAEAEANKRKKQAGAGADAYAGYDQKISERWRGTAAA